MRALNRMLVRLLIVLAASMLVMQWLSLTDSWRPLGRGRWRPHPGLKAVSLVNPFIGTTNGGHVFPGATVPHGMVKAGMDTDSRGNHAGYDALPEYKVTGFSQLHDDGTGGNIPLSNFKLFPLASCPFTEAASSKASPVPHTWGAAGPPPELQNVSSSTSSFMHCQVKMKPRKVGRMLRDDGMPDDEGSPGYFASNLTNGVKVELTATRRTALHRYTFTTPFPEEPSSNVSSTTAETTLIATKQTMIESDADFEKRKWVLADVDSSRTKRPTKTASSKLAEVEEPIELDWRPRIIVDITNDGMFSAQRAVVNIQPKLGRVTGSATFRASFGDGSYSAYVCADFRSPHDLSVPLVPSQYSTYAGYGPLVPGSTFNVPGSSGEQGALLAFAPDPRPPPPYSPRGAQKAYSQAEGALSLNATSNSTSRFTTTAPGTTTTIIARVGVSLISTHQACASAEEEIPDFDFERVHYDARMEWADLLGRVDVEVGGGSESESEEVRDRQKEEAVLMYSSLYRSHIVPADYSEENPLWFSSEPYYDSLYCNWDTYRTLFPLMSLHDPLTYARVVRSFIDIQKHEGWLPECRGSTVQQFIQGGTSADPILAEFYVKFKEYAPLLGVLPVDLWDALVKDAEVESPDWMAKGRQAKPWKQFGFLPLAPSKPSTPGRLPYVSGGYNTRHVSRTLEYAFDDFSISQVARAMGNHSAMTRYLNSSRGFEHVWNPVTPILTKNGTPVEGVVGFMQPRYADGEFAYTDPRRCTANDPQKHTCYLDRSNTDGFYEGGSIVYSQYVPHDTAKLIELQGGQDAFIRRLDFIFDNGYFDSTNEPSQQIPFMYHYANRPGLSTERSRETIKKSYNTSVYGLPGNDDSGAMGSYVAFNMLGLYPLPATRQFLISSPWFRRVSFFNPLFGTHTTIFAPDLDPENGVIYVKRVFINEEEWHSRCYIEWDAFEQGALIELELTDDRTLTCGDDETALPPSLSTGGYS